jgi:DNA replication ATP-dependent helicase Dna2
VRLDKDARVFGMSTLRSNMLSLFLPNTQLAEINANNSSANAQTQMFLRLYQLRELIVDLRAPTFDSGLIARVSPHCRGLVIEKRDDIKMFFPSQLSMDAVNQCVCELEEYMCFYADAAMATTQLQAPEAVAPAAAVITLPSGLPVYAGCNPLDLQQEFHSLNLEQQHAIVQTLAACDYTLIQGYPGAGKSTCVCVLIRLLMARGLRVLLCAYTHAAVDNVVDRLLNKYGVSGDCVYRLGGGGGQSQRGLSLQQAFRNDGKCKGGDGISMNSAVRVVACTALACARDVFVSSVFFDICIIEEAGQIVEPAMIACVSRARTFVCVGDHFQLPPLVVCKHAKEAGMGVSLMSRLAESHMHTEPQNNRAVCVLAHQYRMNAAIMSVCNTLFYGNRMICANPNVARQSLSLNLEMVQAPPNFSHLLSSTPESAHGNQVQPQGTLPVNYCAVRDTGVFSNPSVLMPCWLLQCVHPDNPFVFVNIPSAQTTNKSSSATESGSMRRLSSRNSLEAKTVADIIEALEAYAPRQQQGPRVSTQGSSGSQQQRSAKLKRLSVGVISIYRKQTKEIINAIQRKPTLQHSFLNSSSSKRNCPQSHHPTATDASVCVDVSTVDGFQGREMDIVIVSTAVSGGMDASSAMAEDIIQDWRRLNVAFTRAKCKLIVTGDLDTLSHIDSMKAFCRLIRDRLANLLPYLVIVIICCLFDTEG